MIWDAMVALSTSSRSPFLFYWLHSPRCWLFSYPTPAIPFYDPDSFLFIHAEFIISDLPSHYARASTRHKTKLNKNTTASLLYRTVSTPRELNPVTVEGAKRSWYSLSSEIPHDPHCVHPKLLQFEKWFLHNAYATEKLLPQFNIRTYIRRGLA